MRPIYSAEAVRDLEEIHAYSRITWDTKSADHYVRQLRETCARLMRFPFAGMIAYGEVRRLRFERHVIFYRVDADGVSIERVLHEKQMPGKML